MPDRLKANYQKQIRQYTVLTFARCSEVTSFVVVLLCNFRYCNIIEYYNCCWATICILFSSHNFIDHTYRM